MLSVSEKSDARREGAEIGLNITATNRFVIQNCSRLTTNADISLADGMPRTLRNACMLMRQSLRESRRARNPLFWPDSTEGDSMSETRLANTKDREVRVRERAYHLWEADGRPHGREREFWERAEELVGMEESATSGRLPNPLTHPQAIPGVTIEEAEVQENYGETPGRLTDQGNRPQTPAPRAKSRRVARPKQSTKKQ